MADDKDKHRYKKDKDGFLIEATDPIQDVMTEEELEKAHEKLEKLIEQQNEQE